jgi:hypothetical protein
MSTLYPNSGYTLLDRFKETTDGKNMSKIIQVMNYHGVSDFFADWPFIEASHGLKQQVVRTASIPGSTIGAFDKGTKPTATKSQVVWEDVIQMLQRRQIDCRRVNTLTPEGKKTKLAMEDEFHIQALGKDVVYNFINGAVSSGGEYINGLLPRLDTIATNNLGNVMSAGYIGAGSVTTRLIIAELTPEKGVYGIYPPGYMKNSLNGIHAEDIGREKVTDADDTTATYYAYVAMFEAWFGLAVGNNMKIGAMVNINPTPGGANSVDDDFFDKLAILISRLDLEISRTRIYMNRTMGALFNNYSRSKNNVYWPTTEVFGRPVKDYQGIVIRELDDKIITNVQAVVS